MKEFGDYQISEFSFKSNLFSMHWFHISKTTHNEDAIREYERAESQKIWRWIKRVAIIVVPLALLILWFIRR